MVYNGSWLFMDIHECKNHPNMGSLNVNLLTNMFIWGMSHRKIGSAPTPC